MAKLSNRIQNAWNAFMNKDPTLIRDIGVGSGRDSSRHRLTRGNDRSIISSVYNKIALDVASVTLIHARVNEDGKYLETINSTLNNCLTLEANIDQTGRAFIQDAVVSMFDEGTVALMPVDTDDSVDESDNFKIFTMRTAKVVEWYPRHVKLEAYNDRTGEREQVVMPKEGVAIIENPFFSVMNEPNSTMQRLIRKLNILDAIDEHTGANKLDLIVQLPYPLKTKAKQEQAEKRRKEIENQLANSKYGIAYTDATEHITQLNRAVENNLLSQIEYLTSMLYSQLGMTTSILDGTASEEVMMNYYERTTDPIVYAIVDEIKRKFLTKTARSQGQTIMAFRDPFKLIPASRIAEMSDKLTRNEIMSSNEIRQKIGMKPVADPKADELRNKNLNAGNEQEFATTEENSEGGEIQNEAKM